MRFYYSSQTVANPGLFLKIETSLMPYLLDLIEKADINHDEKIDKSEWAVLGSCNIYSDLGFHA